MSKAAKTYEKKGYMRNGIMRMIFVVAAMALQVGLVVAVFSNLKNHYTLVNTLITVASFLFVMAIYGQHRTSTMKTPWIILTLLFPVLGITLYLLIGLDGATRRMKRRFREVDAKLMPLLPDDHGVRQELRKIDRAIAGTSHYISRIANYPLYNNSDIVFYPTAEDALEAQLQDIQKAEKFIFLQYFAIEYAEAFKRVEKVLVEKVQQGVEVRIFYDDMGSIRFITSDFIRRMESEGIQCRVFNPFRSVGNIFLNNRDHRKQTIIDGKVGHTGGYNLANEYFNLTHPYGHWKDTGIRVEGEAVKSMTVAFLEMWNAIRDGDNDDVDMAQYLPDQPYYTPRESNAFIQPYADTPLDNIQVGEDVYINIVNSAQDYCWFMTPYLILSDEMIRALSLAAERGVDVRIITPGIPDKVIIYSVTKSYYNSLVRNGVKIFQYAPGFCHAKQCVSDNFVATCGTVNLDYRSFYHHFEDGCMFCNCKAVMDVKIDFLKTFEICDDVTEQYRSGRNPLIRFGQMFLRLFSSLL